MNHNQEGRGRWRRRIMRSTSMIITHSFSDSMSHLSPVGGSEGDVDPLQPHSGRVLQQAERYSSADWLTHMMTTFQAPTFRRIRSHLFANVLVAVLVFFAYTHMPQHAALFAWSPIPHTTMGGFLGLLLVFRTNSAYDRFWEARKIWGRMLGRVRVLSGVAHRSLHGADREHFLNLVSRMPEILLWHLKGYAALTILNAPIHNPSNARPPLPSPITHHQSSIGATSNLFFQQFAGGTRSERGGRQRK